MAERRNSFFDPMVLKLDLEIGKDGPEVGCQVEDADGTIVPRWSFPAETMGLPRTLEAGKTHYRGYELELPREHLETVRGGLERDEQPDRPLWIHLVPPYGYLGLVPWESLLQPELGVPILRLPDFLDRPRRRAPQELDVAVISSMPVAKSPFELVESVLRIVDRVLAAGPERTTLHLFSDAEAFPELRSAVEDRRERLRVYDPGRAAACLPTARTCTIGERSEQLRNPWLLWARDALGGQSVDVVHFLAHGFLSQGHGAIALAESPTRSFDSGMARFVGAGELDTFATHVGAWASVLSSPHGNFSEMGLRLLADTLAQLRPGPVVHHELRLDPDSGELGRAYRFLFGPAGTPPPATPALFTYCHPSMLEPEESEGKKRPVRGISKAGRTDLAGPDDDVPAWIAATHRYLEQRRFQLEQAKEAEIVTRDFRRLEEQQREMETSRRTLREIELVMDRVTAELAGGER